MKFSELLQLTFRGHITQSLAKMYKYIEMIADSSFLTALVGIATCCIAFGMLRWKLTKSPDDIILSVLAKTAPDAASDQLSDSVMTCERKLNGVQLIITKGESRSAFSLCIFKVILHLTILQIPRLPTIFSMVAPKRITPAVQLVLQGSKSLGCTSKG